MCSCSNIYPKCIVGLFVLFMTFLLCHLEPTKIMSSEERWLLREEARDMFYHAYYAYMENAYPADELMPLSCKGRYRGLTPNRGDIDDCLGNFSLTLIDTLDSLVILGDLEEFEHAVKLIIKDVSFDSDIVVSVFETNIRVLGGLLSAHVLTEYLQQRDGLMRWYKGELLDMAKDVGYRLLPAFNTTTGIPHARVNLKYGINSDRLEAARETCTACAGSMILEMAALSRLTGEFVFEEKAQKAMDELWKMRHRSSDLMGTVLNVHSGDWIRRDSGVGAGIDSYYEYCLKAYILLGEDKYLGRFNRHYNAIMKYISQGPMLLDVHMHRPHTNSRNYMDALLAFWPGLQVLKGDIKPAVETHEMLYQVMKRHKFIPEAFTTDFQVHWGNHPLRPEFLESTYFLYTATNDPYYLEVGKHVLKSLQSYARVPCGYAAVNDVRTGKQEDRMDSFVLAETFKYLFLLFADKDDLVLNLDEFIFTTEGHLLPLTLANQSLNGTKLHSDCEVNNSEFGRSCPNTLQVCPEMVRKSLQNMINGMCPKHGGRKRLSASEFSASNLNHLDIIKNMGINIIALNDGRVQLLHSFSGARSTAEAEDGLLFMQEMVELSKLQSQQPEASPQSVTFQMPGVGTTTIHAGPAHFGISLKGKEKLTAQSLIVNPFKGCSELRDKNIEGKIAILERGDCMFVDKARNVQKAGGVAAIIIDNVPASSAVTSSMFSMSGDGTDDVKIPAVFIFSQEASKLLLALSKDPAIELTLSELDAKNSQKSDEESMFHKLKMSVQEFLNKHAGIVFTETVKVGHFRADISAEKIRITFERSNEVPVPVEKTINNQWSQIRKGLIRSILHSETKELFIPHNILKIYYQTLSGLSAEAINNQDIVAQTKWFLEQLFIEYQMKDDSLIKVEKELGLSVLADLKRIMDENIDIEKFFKDRKKLQILSDEGDPDADSSSDLIISEAHEGGSEKTRKLKVVKVGEISESEKTQSNLLNSKGTGTYKVNKISEQEEENQSNSIKLKSRTVGEL